MTLTRGRSWKDVDTPKGLQRGGRGAKAFETVLAAADKLGVKEITLLAGWGGSTDRVGYRVWPKFGFDGNLEAVFRDRLPKDLQGVRRLSDLLKTEAGRKYWDEHPYTIPLTFDTAKDSPSRRTWNAYLAGKKKKGK